MWGMSRLASPHKLLTVFSFCLHSGKKILPRT
jgi:hypothetical protein